MGKFSGVLIASDFDNTLVYTEEALRLGLPTPPMSDANRQAIQDFMAQGGIFSIATGRALSEGVPLHTRFIGTGYNKDIRMLGDFGSDLYYIKGVEA